MEVIRIDNLQRQVLTQPNRKQMVKIDLLNNKELVVSTLIGVVLDGNISISNKSAFRRNGSLSIAVHNSQLIPSPTSPIWFDKRVQISVGIENYLNKIIWFNLGKFAYTSCNIVENIEDTVINLELSDYMSFLDGTLGGRITTKVKMIDKNTKINQTIKGILTGLCDFSIENIILNGRDLVLPYRIEKQQGITVYELVKEISNLYMGYEIFFDTNGFFIFQKIRNAKNDEYIWNFDEIDYSISKNTNIDFTKVFNDIWIYGHTDNYGVQVIYHLTNRFVGDSQSKLDNIQNKQKGDICYIKDINKSYVYNGTQWEELGFNVIPDFSVQKIGLKSTIINDNKVYNVEQAKLNAEYQFFSQGRIAETVSLSCVPIFGLDVNKKIKVKGNDYLIDTIDIPLNYDGVMNITASKILY